MTLINRQLIQQTFSAISGIPVLWLNNPRPMVSPSLQAAIYLQVTMLNDLGWDDVRTQYNPTTDMIDTLVVGYRPFTLSVRIESYQELPAAYEYAELLNIGLLQEYYLAPLRAAGLVYTERSNYTDLPVFYDDFAQSCCNIDMKMFAQSTFLTSPLNSTTYISTVGISTDFVDPAGNNIENA